MITRAATQLGVLFATGLSVATVALLAGQGTGRERIQELEQQMREAQQKGSSAERIQELRKQLIAEYEKEESEYWPRRAAALKSKGQFVNRVEAYSMAIVPEGLDQTLRASSVLVATPTGNAIPVAAGRSILTWYSFRDIETLSEKAPPPIRCPSELNRILPTAIPKGELVIPFLGGTLTIDGVRFTYVDGESGFRPIADVRYLMFVHRCSDALAKETHTRSLYPVTSDGTILPSEGPLARELAQVRTVQRLRDRLASLR
jgi:hypothetical protein